MTPKSLQTLLFVLQNIGSALCILLHHSQGTHNYNVDVDFRTISMIRTQCGRLYSLTSSNHFHFHEGDEIPGH